MSFRAQRGISPCFRAKGRSWECELGLSNCVIPSAARNLALLSGQGTKLGVRALKNYYVYIMASTSRTLYTGVTNNLERRVLQHRRKVFGGVHCALQH